MPLDGITSKCLAAELDSILAGARIEKVHQPDRFDIVLHFRRDSANVRLLLSANPSAPRIHFLTSPLENPAEPPTFCMLLRKHLSGSRVIDVTTPSWERVFILRVQGVNEVGDRVERKLIAELMGKQSNIVLVGSNDRILDSLLHVDQSVSRVREVMPGRIYVPVPSQGKPDAAAVLARLSGDGPSFPGIDPSLSLEKVLLASIQGFSPPLCRDICHRSGLDSSLRLVETAPDDLARLTDVLADTLRRILDGAFEPAVFLHAELDAIPYDFHALPLSDSGILRRVATVSEAMDQHFTGREKRNAFTQSQSDLMKRVSSRLEKIVKKLAIHEADRAACADRDRWKRFGDLILASIGQVPPEASSVHLPDYHAEGAPMVEVRLDPTLSPSRNAQRYFRRYTKERIKEENSLRLAEEDRHEIEYLETLRLGIANASEPIDLEALRQEVSQLEGPDPHTLQRKPAPQTRPSKKGSKEPKALPPRHYVSSDGFEILVGRNNLQNDQLTLKKASSGDLWFHVKNTPGTHVIVRTDRREVPDATLLQAAETAAWFSRATSGVQKAGLTDGARTAVDYCPVRNVRKPPGAKPGMVIYDTYRTLYVIPRAPESR